MIVDLPTYGDRITESDHASMQFHLFLESLVNAVNAFQAPSYTVATVPDATLAETSIIYVSDESGGATLAFSDGTNWRRAQDRAIIT